MFDIEQEYNDNVQNLHKLAGLALENVEKLSQSLEIGLIIHDLEKAIDRAKLYDIAQFKRSQGGKKSADNMTAEERKARAIKASHARKTKKSTADNKTRGQNLAKFERKCGYEGSNFDLCYEFDSVGGEE